MLLRAAPGDRVFTYGRHASTIRYSQDRLVAPVREAVDPAVVAASRMAGVAMTAIVVGEIGTSPWVVVFGLGLVGNLASQMFQIHGCRVIGVDPVAARRKLAQRCGIEYTVGGDADETQAEIQEITGGELGDITVDAVGHSSVVMQALRATANHGQLIILGSPARLSPRGLDRSAIRNASTVDYDSGCVRMVCPDVSRHRQPDFAIRQTANDFRLDGARSVAR